MRWIREIMGGDNEGNVETVKGDKTQRESKEPREHKRSRGEI